MAAVWSRSLPATSPETNAFWDGCKNGRLIIQRCHDCGKFQTYYRAFCCHCWGRKLEDREASGRGTVWTYTVIHQNRTPGWDALPYVLACIEVEEGVKLFSNVVNCDPETVRVGMPVKVVFVQATDKISIPFFEPA